MKLLYNAISTWDNYHKNLEKIREAYIRKKCSESQFKENTRKLIDIYNLNSFHPDGRKTKNKSLYSGKYKSNKIAEEIVYHNCVIDYFLRFLAYFIGLNETKNKRLRSRELDEYDFTNITSIKNSRALFNKYLRCSIANSNALECMIEILGDERKTFLSLYKRKEFNFIVSDLDHLFAPSIDTKYRTEFDFLMDDLIKLNNFIKEIFGIENCIAPLSLSDIRDENMFKIHEYLYGIYCNLLVIANYLENPILFKILFDSKNIESDYFDDPF